MIGVASKIMKMRIGIRTRTERRRTSYFTIKHITTILPQNSAQIIRLSIEHEFSNGFGVLRIYKLIQVRQSANS